METVYVDSLILLNAAVDYALLLAAGKICALPLRRGRMLLGALGGGIYALLAVLRPEIFSLALSKLLAGALMTIIAFGLHRTTPRAVVAVYAVAAAFGGAVYAASGLAGSANGSSRFMPVSPRVLLLSFAVCYAAVCLVFRRIARRADRRLCLVQLCHNGTAVSFSALLDTGNELVDPVSGDPVLIADAETLSPLFSGGLPPLGDPLSALEQLSAHGLRCRLIPCSSVAAERSLLLCFRPDSVRVDGRNRTLLIGISPHRLSPDGQFQAIIAQ